MHVTVLREDRSCYATVGLFYLRQLSSAKLISRYTSIKAIVQRLQIIPLEWSTRGSRSWKGVNHSLDKALLDTLSMATPQVIMGESCGHHPDATGRHRRFVQNGMSFTYSFVHAADMYAAVFKKVAMDAAFGKLYRDKILLVSDSRREEMESL
ncbi:hypothetical protein M405DRAFT_881732 [Rhizopogon salebrosus TDB-379]|nr:hypothetical protein M405DRAFT_881732 [Rhizopogon salebrosus TDB-379]